MTGNNEYNYSNVGESCNEMKVIGVYSAFLFFASLIANSLLIWIIFRNKHLRTPINYLISSLAIVNLAGSFIELPIVAISAFNCRFVFGDFGCTFEAFVMYFVGCTSIYILVAISVERYFVIRNPFQAHLFNTKTSILSVLVCASLALIWCLSPLFGWSYYTYEGTGISCSVEWHARTPSVMSYNIAIFIFVYVTPLTLLIGTNTHIILMIKKSGMKFDNDKAAKRKIKKERHLVIMAIILISAFFISWTPYAIVALYIAFGKNTSVAPLTATLPAFVAKASLIWPSFVNLIGNNEIRGLIPFLKTQKQVSPLTMNETANKSTNRTIH